MTKKQCSKCKKWKEESEFSKDKSRKDGMQVKCEKCDKECHNKNIEKIKINKKIYYQNNKLYFKNKGKEYRERNKGEINYE